MSVNLSAQTWLTKRELAAKYRMKPRTIDAWMARGLLPYFKPGSSKQTPVRFDAEAVVEALAKFNRGAAK